MRKLGSLGVLALSIGLGACAHETQEEEAISTDELRSDPSATVSTNDPAVKLLSGYNAFLDQAATTECVTVAAAKPPSIASVQGSFYLRHVTSREDLAKELDVDVAASVKATQASVDASTKIVSTFKTSSRTVNFLVRAYRTYVASNNSDIELAPAAMEILGRGAMPEFLQKCGGSYAKSVRYDAQVIAMLQFEAQNEESAQKIAVALNGSTPEAAKPVANASVDLKTKAETTAAREGASLSVTVVASGFLTNGRKVEGVVEHSFEKIDELHQQLATSFDKDIASDRADYANNNSRNVRPGMVMQASYSTLKNAPAGADFNKNTQTLASAENFVRQISPAYVRMQRAFDDEIQPFLRDTANQWRYNLVTAPKRRTQDLVPIAQKWAQAFSPEGTRSSGSLADPLKEAIEACTSAAANGDYTPCANNAGVTRDKGTAETQLADYAKNGRILPVTAWMPQVDKFVSYYNADDICTDAGMRLPKREEMALLGPAVMALSGDAGQVWFAGDAKCSAPVYANGNGQGAELCKSGWAEWMPWVDDNQVICVAKSGAVQARSAP